MDKQNLLSTYCRILFRIRKERSSDTRYSTDKLWRHTMYEGEWKCSSFQLCLTLHDPRNCSLPGSPVHGILQARILESVAIPFSSDMPNSGIKPGPPTLHQLIYEGKPLVAQLVKNMPAMWETWVRSLGWEDPLEMGKSTHSSILA